MSNEAIRERLAKATPGPWDTHPAVSYWVLCNSGTHELCNCELTDDANFIAHARTDIPDLLAQVDAKDKRIAELEAELSRYTEHVCKEDTAITALGMWPSRGVLPDEPYGGHQS